jgi:LacI family transcriptional regulator
LRYGDLRGDADGREPGGRRSRVNAARPEEAGQRTRVKAVDVAERAGVSVATVSLVTNGKAAGRVSEHTCRRVQQAIEELGYVVNPAARSLATGRRQCVAFVARDMTNPFISSVAAGVAEALGTQTQLLLAVSGAGSQEPDLRHIISADVDGVLLGFPVAMPREELEAQCPVVVMDDPKTSAGGSSVCFDLRAGARELADHLVTLGHRTVLYLDTPRQAATFSERWRYLSEQLRRHQKETKVLRTHSDIEIRAAREKVLAYWPSWEDQGVTAIVAASDVQAYGVLAALSDLKVEVPGQVSVASFDGLPFAAIVSPALTTISLPAFDLGFEAATLLQDMIERGSRTRRSVVLPSHLAVRDSTGPSRLADPAS